MGRKPWETSFQQGDSFRDRQRQHETPAAGEGQRKCAYGEWCHGRRVTTVDGSAVITPALTYRPFCSHCERYLGECIAALPAGYRDLERELGQVSRTGRSVRVPFGPRLPLREEIDALMRLTAIILCAWEARVSATAKLTRRDPRAPIHSARAVAGAAGTLSGNLTTLTSLEPKWMSRVINLPPARRGGVAAISDKETGELIEALREFADDDLVRHGVDSITVGTKLGGEAAGLEIFRLYHRARSVLGEVGNRPDTLDGIPCKACDDMALERAEPPSDPSLPAMYSQCASCRHQMNHEDFLAWAAMYAKWADDSGLTCRRCTAGRCPECRYARCACAHRGHAAA